jgi:hypothetical protein
MDLKANFMTSVARSVSDGLLDFGTLEEHMYTLPAKTIEDLMERLQAA